MLCGIIILFLSAKFSQSEFRTGSWRTEENEYENRNNLSGNGRDYQPADGFGGSQKHFVSNDRLDGPRRWGDNRGNQERQENNSGYPGYPATGNDLGYSNFERTEKGYSTPEQRENNAGFTNPRRTGNSFGYATPERTKNNSGYSNPERKDSNLGYSNPEITENNLDYSTPKREEKDLGYSNPGRTDSNSGYSKLEQRENNAGFTNPQRTGNSFGYTTPERTKNNSGYSNPERTASNLGYLNFERSEGNSGFSTPQRQESNFSPQRRENNSQYSNSERTESNSGYSSFTRRETNAGNSNPKRQETNPGNPNPTRRETNSGNSNPKQQETNSGNSNPTRRETNSGNSNPKQQETNSGNSNSKQQETNSGNPNPKRQETNSGNPNSKRQETNSGNPNPKGQDTNSKNSNPNRQETNSGNSNPKGQDTNSKNSNPNRQETNSGNSNPKGQDTNSKNSNPKRQETKTGDSSTKQGPPPAVKCGLDVPRRIIGGTTTDIDEFPWLCLLEYSNPSGNVSYDCSGVLISKRYVLTAAHCTNGPGLRAREMKVRRVRLGEWDVSSDKDCQGDVCSAQLQDIDVENIIAHENYKPNDKSQVNDIALIRLKSEAKLTQYVQPICLPSDKIGGADYEDKKLTVSGWGRTSNAKDSSSNVKMKVELPVVNRERCRRFYESFYGNLKIADTQFCAGGEEGKDTCQGDSGGPLMTIERTNNEIKWYVIGIVSSGPAACGVQDRPSLYTNVSQYMNWIKNNIKN